MKINKILSLSTAILLFAGCSFLEVTPQVICSDTFYNTKDEALSALVGVYGAINNEAFYGNYYSLMCSNVDDLCYFNRSTTANYTNIYRHDASSTEIYSAWTEIYKGVCNANAFMDAITQTEFDEDGKLYAEARFLRAYYHFVLAQAWGDVPLRNSSVVTNDEVMIKATPQYDVLTWVASEMEACLANLTDDLENAPSRVNVYTAHAILSRVYLFMAGESVQGGNKSDFYKKAMEHSETVIKSGKFNLNPEYKQVFINMISDEYDKVYYESMWEAEFMGLHTSDAWSNGRIGDLIGLQSSGSSNYDTFLCNFAYGQYDGSLKLWDLYWAEDRTEDETMLSKVTDKRQEWNMPPYNYAGCTSASLGINIPASTQKAPYIYAGTTSFTVGPDGEMVDNMTAVAIRNCGKWRREKEYEPIYSSKQLYTGINFPIMRYSDVLLMYAEASLEYTGAVSQEAYDAVVKVRQRADISTRSMSSYDANSFRQLVRNERGRELVFEATRKYDLIRWGIFVEAMKGYVRDASDDRWSGSAKSGYAANIGSAVQPKHVVLPVPSVELGVNTLLTQNPLW
ncbi:MAG: RagB/SusD family nutrient uptake outer membrane protein [Candidatus Cryptobacteroides sp.]